VIKEDLCVVERGSATAGEAQRQAAIAAEPMAAYLEYWPSRGVSKHMLMGPVAIILDTLRRSDASPEQLLGRAMRAHELAAQGRMPAEAQESLEKGVRALVALVKPLKPAERVNALTAVEWEVFYHRRKRRQQYLAERDAAWQAFVRQRYADDLATIQHVWARPDLTDWRRLPSPARLRNAEGPAGQDASAFYKELAARRTIPAVEDDEGTS
jgi:hypothetical protein